MEGHHLPPTLREILRVQWIPWQENEDIFGSKVRQESTLGRRAIH